MRLAIYHHLHSGGAKRVVMEQAYRLCARHDVTLFTLTTADQSFAKRDTGAPFATVVSSFTAYKSLASPWGRLNPLIALGTLRQLDRLARQTAHAIDRQRFDVVIVHPCQITQAPLLLRWLQTPTLYYCHELPRRLYESPVPRAYRRRGFVRGTLDLVDPLPRMQRSILRRLDRQSATRATRIAVNSHFTGENVKAAYRREAAVCMPAVEARDFQPGTKDRERFVLSVGALTPNKGFDFVITALATIDSAERPPLVIVSNYEEPEERRYLLSLAAQKGVSVECRLGVAEKELRRWYARAGCVAYAPVNEPLGLVTLEAMASGAPLVVVDEGGVPEPILNGETGFCLARSRVAFGNAIRAVLRDRPLAKALGERARQHVLVNCTWNQHVSGLESLLRDTERARQTVVPISPRVAAL